MAYMLELFTHSGCIFREDDKWRLESVLKDFPQINFKEINIIEDRQRADSLGVKMFPTLAFNNQVICVGIPPSGELEKLLRKAMKGYGHVS